MNELHEKIKSALAEQDGNFVHIQRGHGNCRKARSDFSEDEALLPGKIGVKPEVDED